MDGDGWLARVRHDLVKRMLWPARDRRELGGRAAPGELVATLIDDEGRAVTAETCWASLRADAPDGVSSVALERFADAVRATEAAARAGDVDGVLALDAAFAALVQNVKDAKGEGRKAR